jgi:hypothetical protein
LTSNDEDVVQSIGRRRLTLEEIAEKLAAEIRARTRSYEVTVKECD